MNGKHQRDSVRQLTYRHKARICSAFVWISILSIIFLTSSFNWLRPSLSDEVSANIRSRIEGLKTHLLIPCTKERLCGSGVLVKFYRERFFKPVWIDDSGITSQAGALIRAVESVKDDGLDPDRDCRIDEIKAMVDEYGKFQGKGLDCAKRLADLDILMTNSFFVCGSYLLSGKVKPERVNDEWKIGQRDDDLAKTLERAVKNNNIEETFERLRPQEPGYKRLVQALRFYRGIAASGGWPVIPTGPSIKIGQSDRRVPMLRTRLAISGDIDPAAGRRSGDIFDQTIKDAVTRFQKRHGLDPDGVVGHETISAMNVPVEQRIRQIVLNLERWRWLPKDLGRRYIIVNIANFELSVVEDGKSVMKMEVIVGRNYRQTPVFSSEITSITINPYWRIPYSIAVKDILPELRKNPGYLDKKHIKVINSNGEEESEAFDDQIDWKNISDRDFNYRLRQDPGPLNALGRIKFDIPNRYGVYLHDTPAQALFKKTRRDFSSGCIRLERPLDIAAYILNGDADWPRDKILEAIASKKIRTIRLKKPIPVHVVYMTAWVSEDGLLNFRQDIYGRDTIPDKKLQQTAHTRE